MTYQSDEFINTTITPEDSLPKAKLYRFGELSKEAKDTAGSEVYEKEVYKPQDYSHETEHLEEYLAELVRDEGLDVEDNSIHWSSHYGISPDLSEVKINDAYIKKVLSKEDFEMYEALVEMSDGYMESNLFHDNEKGIALLFYTASSGVHEEPAMDFIVNYSSDEDIKAKYKLALLFTDENGEMESNEGIEDLEFDLQTLGEQLAEQLSSTISKPLEKLYDKIFKAIHDNEEYIGSQEYFYDQLESECYLSEQYLFNVDGNIILEDDKFLNEDDEELYEPYEN